MPLSRRYSPEWAPGEIASIGIDMSNIIPPGVGILGAQLLILTNTVPPQETTDFTAQAGATPGWFATSVVGRAVYATISGGVEGRDYQLEWAINDSGGNAWVRTALLLCAPTS
jgi:hypothetical protein